MIDLFEKTVLAGIGALSLTQKKGEELLAELKEKYDLSEEKGRELVDRLKGAAEENQKKLEEIARDEVKRVVEKLGLATRAEVTALEERIAALEKKLADN